MGRGICHIWRYFINIWRRAYICAGGIIFSRATIALKIRFNGSTAILRTFSGMFGVVDSGRLSACSNPKGFFSQARVVGVGLTSYLTGRGILGYDGFFNRKGILWVISRRHKSDLPEVSKSTYLNNPDSNLVKQQSPITAILNILTSQILQNGLSDKEICKCGRIR